MPFQSQASVAVSTYYQEVECPECEVTWSRQIGYKCWLCGKTGHQVARWELYAGCKQTVNWDTLDRLTEQEEQRDRDRLESLLLVRGASPRHLEDMGTQEG